MVSEQGLPLPEIPDWTPEMPLRYEAVEVTCAKCGDKFDVPQVEYSEMGEDAKYVCRTCLQEWLYFVGESDPN
jgi:hypothetical protein